MPMNRDLGGILKSLWERRVQDEWVFLNSKTGTRFNRRPKFMRSLCRRAGIPNYGFHSIRHFIASYLYDREKIGKATLQRLLGHQSPTTTDIYLHSMPEGMREAVDRLEGAFDPVATSSGGSERNRAQTAVGGGSEAVKNQ